MADAHTAPTADASRRGRPARDRAELRASSGACGEPAPRVLALVLAGSDLDLAVRAFPTATLTGFAALGLVPGWTVRADLAVRGAARLARDGETILVVTSLDLRHPDLPSLLGFADRRRRVAVVSFARLRHTDDDVTIRRVRNVAAHESGHLRGLRHCREGACLMRSADGPAALDSRPDDPCPSCRDASRTHRTARLFAARAEGPQPSGNSRFAKFLRRGMEARAPGPQPSGSPRLAKFLRRGIAGGGR